MTNKKIVYTHTHSHTRTQKDSYNKKMEIGKSCNVLFSSNLVHSFDLFRSYMITVSEVVKENSDTNVCFLLEFQNTSQSSEINFYLTLKGDASHGLLSEYNRIELTLPAGKLTVTVFINWCTRHSIN